MDWRRQAICTGKTDVFFDETNPASVARAKAICAGCPVREECLEESLVNRDRDGVWGGLDPSERRQLLRDAERAARRRDQIARSA